MAQTSEKLDGISHFMAAAYNGNKQLRWGKDTPYFDTAKTGITETVPAHEWACGLYWLVLRRHFPHLNAAVDALKVHEILTTHDLGETYRGDTSLMSQLKGDGIDKHIIEREEIMQMASRLDYHVLTEMRDMFDDFEAKWKTRPSLEALVANLVDTIQGNHFALVFGHDLPKHSEIISSAINKFQVPVFKRLVERLTETGQTEAAQEVRQILSHHVQQIAKAGINLDTSNFGDLLID